MKTIIKILKTLTIFITFTLTIIFIIGDVTDMRWFFLIKGLGFLFGFITYKLMKLWM